TSATARKENAPEQTRPTRAGISPRGMTASSLLVSLLDRINDTAKRNPQVIFAGQFVVPRLRGLGDELVLRRFLPEPRKRGTTNERRQESTFLRYFPQHCLNF